MRMLQSAQAQIDDMVGMHVSRELIEVATKKLEATLKHQE